VGNVYVLNDQSIYHKYVIHDLNGSRYDIYYSFSDYNLQNNLYFTEEEFIKMLTDNTFSVYDPTKHISLNKTNIVSSITLLTKSEDEVYILCHCKNKVVLCSLRDYSYDKINSYTSKVRYKIAAKNSIRFYCFYVLAKHSSRVLYDCNITIEAIGSTEEECITKYYEKCMK
jgi:hypothetical protein